MLDDKPKTAAQDDPAGPSAAPLEPNPSGDEPADGPPAFDESLIDELGALIDDGRTYAEAELTFQKTRAALAGKSVAMALVFAIVAVILLHIAVLALAVGMVMALAPLVTIWGAIAIVVGVLLIATGLLGYAAARRGKLISALFAGDKEKDAQEA